MSQVTTEISTTTPILDAIIPKELIEKNSLIKVVEDEQVEASATVLLQMLYPNENGNPSYLYDPDLTAAEKAVTLLIDTLNADTSNEEFLMMGLTSLEYIFPFPYIFIDLIEYKGIHTALKYLPKIMDMITSNLEVDKAIKDILSLKVVWKKEGQDVNIDHVLELEEIYNLVDQNIIDPALLVDADSDVLSLDFYLRFKDKLDIESLFNIAKMPLELFQYCEENGMLNDIDSLEFTVSQPHIILENPEYREKYFDRIQWDKALIKRKFPEEFLEVLIERGVIDWGNCSIYQILSDEFIEKYKLFLPAPRKTISWNKDIAPNPVLSANDVILEDWKKHTTDLDQELTWNELLEKHGDKIQIGWFAGLQLSQMPLMTVEEMQAKFEARQEYYAKHLQKLEEDAKNKESDSDM